MKLNEVTVGRKFNLGNFETLEIRVSVSPGPEEERLAFEAAQEQCVTKLDAEIRRLAAEVRR